MSYQDLSEDDKLAEAIRFVALGQQLPEVLSDFLKSAGLYEVITSPGDSR